MRSQAGNLTQAKQQLEECLRILRSLHGDRVHPDIAERLLGLGRLSYVAGDGDLTRAKQLLEESLQMERSLHGDRDHPNIAEALFI